MKGVLEETLSKKHNPANGETTKQDVTNEADYILTQRTINTKIKNLNLNKENTLQIKIDQTGNIFVYLWDQS